MCVCVCVCVSVVRRLTARRGVVCVCGVCVWCVSGETADSETRCVCVSEQ